uniref:Uncharacterized protein n=1 Tax=Rhizophora mucronata TaxID=61149 RepID=A0A2P2PAQ6_RHIMU
MTIYKSYRNLLPYTLLHPCFVCPN